MVDLLDVMKMILKKALSIAGLLQVQQPFDAYGAIYIDFWILLPFCCLHCIRTCRLVNLKVVCFLFGKNAVG